MSYEYITNRDSPNFWSAADLGGYGTITIESLTIHHWGAVGAQFGPTVDWLCRPAGNTSAHEVIEAGRVAQVINFGNAAWHSGSYAGNTTSYSLELNPRAWDSDYATAGERIADIWATYGRLPLVPHKSWSATECPGAYDLARLESEAETWFRKLYLGQAQAVEETPAPSSSWPALAWTVDPGDTLGAIASHYGLDAETVAAHNGLADVNQIDVGQVLAIPGPSYWTVQPGDTLGAIADYYGVGTDRLVSLNALADADQINVGQLLVVQP